MHHLFSILAATTTTTAKSKSSASSNYTLLFIIVLFAAVYLLFIRPRQQKMRQQQTAARQLTVGDPVVTAGGIHGTLVSLTDDQAEVEVAPGVVMTFLRRAVNARPGAAAAPQTDEHEDDLDDPWAGSEGHADATPEHEAHEAHEEQDEHGAAEASGERGAVGHEEPEGEGPGGSTASPT